MLNISKEDLETIKVTHTHTYHETDIHMCIYTCVHTYNRLETTEERIG